MFWIRLFWFEAFALPAYFLYHFGTAPAETAYRTWNLIVWSATLAAALYGFVQSRRKRAAAVVHETSSEGET